MNVLPIARKDFRDAARSKVFVGVLTLFVLFAVGLTALYADLAIPDEGTPDPSKVTLEMVAFMSGRGLFGVGPVSALVPIVGLLLGIKSIVGERESGSIKLLLSLPHSRADVLFGKFAGRSAVAGVSLLVGFVLAGGVLAFAAVDPLVFGQFLLVTLLFVLVHVAVGMGISAAAPSDGWATVLVVAFIGIFQALWGLLFTILRVVAFEGRPPADWYHFLHSLSPGYAYGHSLEAVVSGFEESVGESGAIQPYGLPDLFWVFVLLAWAAIPLALGYWAFERADLG